MSVSLRALGAVAAAAALALAAAPAATAAAPDHSSPVARAPQARLSLTQAMARWPQAHYAPDGVARGAGRFIVPSAVDGYALLVVTERTSRLAPAGVSPAEYCWVNKTVTATEYNSYGSTSLTSNGAYASCLSEAEITSQSTGCSEFYYTCGYVEKKVYNNVTTRVHGKASICYGNGGADDILNTYLSYTGASSTSTHEYVGCYILANAPSGSN